MHCYRPINPIQAITFDLDDTLYDNVPHMEQALNAMMKEIQKVDGLQQATLSEFDQIKHALTIDDPSIYHDVTRWRTKSIYQFLKVNGINDSQTINNITDNAMNAFIYWRNQISVPQASLNLLEKLAERYPLAIISNGNADVNKIGLSDYFQFSLRSGVDGLSKPYSDMFHLASHRLKINPEHILHVGDNLNTDVIGAINSGMMACWLQISHINIYQQPETRLLPHFSITDLLELKFLL